MSPLKRDTDVFVEAGREVRSDAADADDSGTDADDSGTDADAMPPLSPPPVLNRECPASPAPKAALLVAAPAADGRANADANDKGDDDDSAAAAAAASSSCGDGKVDAKELLQLRRHVDHCNVLEDCRGGEIGIDEEEKKGEWGENGGARTVLHNGTVAATTATLTLKSTLVAWPEKTTRAPAPASSKNATRASAPPDETRSEVSTRAAARPEEEDEVGALATMVSVPPVEATRAPALREDETSASVLPEDNNTTASVLPEMEARSLALPGKEGTSASLSLSLLSLSSSSSLPREISRAASTAVEDAEDDRGDGGGIGGGEASRKTEDEKEGHDEKKEEINSVIVALASASADSASSKSQENSGGSTEEDGGEERKEDDDGEGSAETEDEKVRAADAAKQKHVLALMAQQQDASVVNDAEAESIPAPTTTTNSNSNSNTKSITFAPPPPTHQSSLALAAVPLPSRRQRSESRDELHRCMNRLRRRRSLTPREYSFLERLVVHGNDVEVEMAKSKLEDRELFFERNLESFGPDNDVDDDDDDDDDTAEETVGTKEAEKTNIVQEDVPQEGVAAVAVDLDKKSTIQEECTGGRTKNQRPPQPPSSSLVVVDPTLQGVERITAAGEGTGKRIGKDKNWINTWVWRGSRGSSETPPPASSFLLRQIGGGLLCSPDMGETEDDGDADANESMDSASRAIKHGEEACRGINRGPGGRPSCGDPQSSVVFGRAHAYAKSRPLSMDGMSAASFVVDDGDSKGGGRGGNVDAGEGGSVSSLLSPTQTRLMSHLSSQQVVDRGVVAWQRQRKGTSYRSERISMDGVSVGSFLEDGLDIGGNGKRLPLVEESSQSAAGEDVEVILQEGADEEQEKRSPRVEKLRDQRGRSLGTIELNVEEEPAERERSSSPRAEKLGDDRDKSLGNFELSIEDEASIAAAAAAVVGASVHTARFPANQEVTRYNSLACTTSASCSVPDRPGPLPLKERRQRSQSVGSAFSSLSLGSVERRAELENRRKDNSLYGKLWKAHESGLALTKDASRNPASLKNASRKTSILVGGGGGGGGSGGGSLLHRKTRSFATSANGSTGGAPAATRRRGGEGGVAFRHCRANSIVSTSSGRDSFLSAATLDLLEHGGPLNREGESAIFRREIEERAIFRGVSGKTSATCDGPLPVRDLRLASRVTSEGSNNGRASVVSSLGGSDKSATSFFPGPPNLDIRALTLDELPEMPASGSHQRCTSTGSRVTFADENMSAPAALEEEVDGADLRGAAMRLLPKLPEASAKPPTGSVLRKKDFGVTSSSVRRTNTGSVFRRSSQMSPKARRQRARSTGGRILLPPMMQQPGPSAQEGRHHRYVRSESQVSMESIPCLPHGHSVRSDSVVSAQMQTSIPAIRLANHLRSESVVSTQSQMSIPAIQLANHLRSESVVSIQSPMSIPAIRLASHLRSDSFVSAQSNTSIPAIQHAHHLRSESVVSVRSQPSAAPSSSLRPGRPVRSESFEGSLLSFGSESNIDPDLMGAVAEIPEGNSTIAAVVAEADGAVDELSSAAPLFHPKPTPKLKERRLPTRPSRSPSNGSSAEVDMAVIVRRASRNIYGGEGIEVTELDSHMSVNTMEDTTESAAEARKYASMNSLGVESNVVANDTGNGIDDTSMADLDAEERDAGGEDDVLVKSADNNDSINPFWLNADQSSVVYTGGSFDDGDSIAAMRRSDMIDSTLFDRELKRSLSDEGLLLKSGDIIEYVTDDEVMGSDYGDGEDGASWDLTSDPDTLVPQQDAWNVLKDEYALGYGAGGTLPFLILGTSADDVVSLPHVLSPPLMESLQCFFPYSVSEDNFWMKFSMVRDGASLHTLLQNVRGAQHTIIAVETVEGEVFGSFTSVQWRKNWNYFGTGESFLWRMRENRHGANCRSIIDQAQLESELDVYPWTGENNFVQLCTHDRIAVGGGTEQEIRSIPSSPTSFSSKPTSPSHLFEESGDERVTSWESDNSDFGFGIAIDGDLLHGTSSPCLTFGSPGLSKIHVDGSPFEILNLEVWTLTPCISVDEAEKLELGRLFLDSSSD